MGGSEGVSYPTLKGWDLYCEDFDEVSEFKRVIPVFSG